MRIILVFIFILVCSLLKAQEAEVDHVALAQIFVKDGHFQRAEQSLKNLTDAEKHDHKAMVFTLWGIVYLHKGQNEKALELFDKSLLSGIKESEIHIYRAEAFLKLKRLTEALQALFLLQEEQKKKLPYFLLQAEVYWQKNMKQKAWSVLNQALMNGLSKVVIEKKKFSYLMQEQLYQVATEKAFQLLLIPGTFNDVLAMSSQLRIAHQHSLSLQLLQSLQVMRPEKEMVALEMAQNYLTLNEKFSAALVLEQAAKHNSSLSYEASEILRQIGKSYRARFLNLSTLDPQKKLKQKLALYLEDDDYLSLKLLIPQLVDQKMLDNQEIRYVVAYSLFRIGDFSKSEEYLNKIDKDGLFEKSIELKREISACREKRWDCSETI